MLNFSLTNFIFPFAFPSKSFYGSFEYYFEVLKTLRKFKTTYDAMKCIHILKNIEYCDMWVMPNYFQILEMYVSKIVRNKRKDVA